MILQLKISTLKELLKKTEQAKNNCSTDDISAMEDDDRDFVELIFNNVGMEDKKKDIHEEVSEDDIEEINIRIHCQTVYDEKVTL